MAAQNETSKAGSSGSRGAAGSRPWVIAKRRTSRPIPVSNGDEDEERGDDRRVGGAGDAALREDDLERVAAAGREDAVHPRADQERADDAALGDRVAR